MTAIPELEPHCGSWVVIDRQTGQAIWEIFDRTTAEAINQVRYELRTTLQHLASMNAS